MKTSIIKQEILLLITPFSKKELCEKDPSKALKQSVVCRPIGRSLLEWFAR